MTTKEALWEASDHTKNTAPQAWVVLVNSSGEPFSPGEALIGVAFRCFGDAIALVQDQLNGLDLESREQEAVDALLRSEDKEHRTWEDGNGLQVEIRLISIV